MLGNIPFDASLLHNKFCFLNTKRNALFWLQFVKYSIKKNICVYISAISFDLYIGYLNGIFHKLFQVDCIFLYANTMTAEGNDSCWRYYLWTIPFFFTTYFLFLLNSVFIYILKWVTILVVARTAGLTCDIRWIRWNKVTLESMCWWSRWTPVVQVWSRRACNGRGDKTEMLHARNRRSLWIGTLVPILRRTNT